MQEIEITGTLKHDRASHKTRHLVLQPMMNVLKGNAGGLQAINHFLKGTDSNEWLILAEKKAYKTIKDGN
jgi:hypothetical protein